MFEAKEIVQSVSDPRERKLVLVDGAERKELKLPACGPELVELEGKLYDCYGREVKIQPEIKRIVREFGIGQIPNYAVSAKRSMFLVEKQNGRFAFAGVRYDGDVGYSHWDEANGNLFTALPLASAVELRCLKRTNDQYCDELSDIQEIAFGDTPIGKKMKGLCENVWLGHFAESKRTVLFSYPYKQIYAKCYSDKGQSFGQYLGMCIFQQFDLSPDGTQLIVQLRAHPDLDHGGGDGALRRTIRAEMTLRPHDEELRGTHFESREVLPFHILDVLTKN